MMKVGQGQIKNTIHLKNILDKSSFINLLWQIRHILKFYSFPFVEMNEYVQDFKRQTLYKFKVQVKQSQIYKTKHNSSSHTLLTSSKQADYLPQKYERILAVKKKILPIPKRYHS